jgi:hypothetical protein
VSQADLSETVRRILVAVAELSREQAACDSDRERTTAPRDHALQKTVTAFREFEAGAKSLKGPLTVKIRLTPSADASADSKA